MNKFLTVVFATTLLASPAIAEDKKVTVPTPKSITITCSDDVRPGTLVLSNPPKFSCKDYDLAKDMIGTVSQSALPQMLIELWLICVE